MKANTKTDGSNSVQRPISKSFPVSKEEEHSLERLEERPGIRVISVVRRLP